MYFWFYYCVSIIFINLRSVPYYQYVFLDWLTLLNFEGDDDGKCHLLGCVLMCIILSVCITVSFSWGHAWQACLQKMLRGRGRTAGTRGSLHYLLPQRALNGKSVSQNLSILLIYSPSLLRVMPVFLEQMRLRTETTPGKQKYFYEGLLSRGSGLIIVFIVWFSNQRSSHPVWSSG